MRRKKNIIQGVATATVLSNIPIDSLAFALEDFSIENISKDDEAKKEGNIKTFFAKTTTHRKYKKKNTIKVNRNIRAGSVLEIRLDNRDFVPDLSGNPDGYETVKVITTGDKSLTVQDYNNLRESGIYNIDLSEATSSFIPNNAFLNASHLLSFSFPKEVTSIGVDAFKGCTGLTGDLIIPDTVSSLGSSAFEECTGFDGRLVLPSNLKNIDNYVFRGCVNFTGDLIIPNSTTSIGSTVFAGCSGFNGVLKLSSSLTYLGVNAFEGCTGFVGDLIIPNKLKTLANHVFLGCSGFNGRLVIGESVESIGVGTFSGCSGFVGDLIIPDSVISTSTSSFSNCSSFNGVLTLGKSLQTIGQGSFLGCSNLTGRLIIPNSVKTIGMEAFSRCSGFTGNLVIPDSTTSLGASAFLGCSGLNGKLILGKSLPSIQSNVFKDCRGFTGDLIIPDSVTSIGASAFSGCTGFTGDLIISDSVTSIGNSAFYGCSSFKGTLTLGNSLQTIVRMAFMGCSGFTGDLIIPDSVISVGDHSFSNCSGFNGNLKLSNSMTKVEAATFRGCSGLTGDVVIPSSVISIGDYAFRECKNLDGDILIPDSVEAIGSLVFGNCSNLDKIRVCVNSSNIDSETKQNVIRAIPSGNLAIEIPYDFDITGTWLESYTTMIVKPVVKFEVDGIEHDSPIDTRADSVSLYISASFKESNVSVVKEGKTFKLPQRNADGTYTFDELGEYEVTVITNLGQTYAIKFNVKNKQAVDAEEAVDNLGSIASVVNISNARELVNNLPESVVREELQNRLNSVATDLALERLTTSANIDVYIKSENMLSLSLNTNTVSFDNYSGAEPMEKLDAVNITINSSLPYNLNAYMPTEIIGSDRSNKIDLSVFNIKESSETLYQKFSDTTNKIILKENCQSGNGIKHSINLRLDSSEAHVSDVYKTTVKFEVEQK